MRHRTGSNTQPMHAGSGSVQTVSPDYFRQVLGHLPTGACVLTAVDADGRPHGMSCNSFTSLSLVPPLVGFAAGLSSTTWPIIREASSFVVNVLSENQHELCRRFPLRGTDRFADVEWAASPAGNPLLDGTVAWLECEIANEYPAGDHNFVHAAVIELSAGGRQDPLIVFRGDFGALRSQRLQQPRNADLHRTRW